jgi:two-component system, NarL family, sensor kinase
MITGKRIRVYFFLFSFPLVISAQTKEIDSLFQLTKTAAPARRISLYAEISETARNVFPDTSFYFAKQAMLLAEETGNATGRLKAYTAMGRVLHVRGSYDLSIKYHKEALDLAQGEKNDSMAAVSLNGIGNSLWQLGRHAEALENLFSALRIRERLNDTRGIILCKTSIGMVYQTEEKLQLAEKYIHEALDLIDKKEEPDLQLSSMHTLANIYGMQGKIKEAFAVDKEGIQIAEERDNEVAKSLFYDNIGNCYLYNTPPDYQRAIEYFQKTLAIDSAFGNRKQMSDSYSNMGSVFFEQKKFADAIPFLQRSLALADESGYTQGKLKVFQMLSTAYRQSGRGDEAYASLQSAIRVKDSFITASSEAKMAEMQTLYETEKKQQKITLQQEQLSKKNYILWGIIAVALLLGLLGVSYYRRTQLKQKAKHQEAIIDQQDLATRAVIEAEEEERQRIARDLHDGIGQMMSAAKMNLSAFEAGMDGKDDQDRESLHKIIGLVDESCREIRTVSHNMMPNALLKSNLATAVGDFLDKIDKSTLKIHLYTTGLDEHLDTNTETVLYRVIQEAVNNVLKHAKASVLDISLVKDADGISATIEDNGRGFDATDPSKNAGIGLKNIRKRVDYLKGHVDFDSAPGRGTVVSLHIPAE